MRNFNPAVEDLMKVTPTDLVTRSEPSNYTAHKGWFQLTNETKIDKQKIKKKKK